MNNLSKLRTPCIVGNYGYIKYVQKYDCRHVGRSKKLRERGKGRSIVIENHFRKKVLLGSGSKIWGANGTHGPPVFAPALSYG